MPGLRHEPPTVHVCTMNAGLQVWLIRSTWMMSARLEVWDPKVHVPWVLSYKCESHNTYIVSSGLQVSTCHSTCTLSDGLSVWTSHCTFINARLLTWASLSICTMSTELQAWVSQRTFPLSAGLQAWASQSTSTMSAALQACIYKHEPLAVHAPRVLYWQARASHSSCTEFRVKWMSLAKFASWVLWVWQKWTYCYRSLICCAFVTK